MFDSLPKADAAGKMVTSRLGNDASEPTKRSSINPPRRLVLEDRLLIRAYLAATHILVSQQPA